MRAVCTTVSTSLAITDAPATTDSTWHMMGTTVWVSKGGGVGGGSGGGSGGEGGVSSISRFPDKARKVTKIENKARRPFETGTGGDLVLRWVSTAEERARPATTVVGVAREGMWVVICCRQTLALLLTRDVALGRFTVSGNLSLLKGLQARPPERTCVRSPGQSLAQGGCSIHRTSSTLLLLLLLPCTLGAYVAKGWSPSAL